MLVLLVFPGQTVRHRNHWAQIDDTYVSESIEHKNVVGMIKTKSVMKMLLCHRDSRMTLEEMDKLKISSKIEAVQELSEVPENNNNDSEKENLMQTVAGNLQSIQGLYLK